MVLDGFFNEQFKWNALEEIIFKYVEDTKVGGSASNDRL